MWIGSVFVRRRFIAIPVAVLVLGVVAAYAFGAFGPRLQRTAATDNMNCTLIVPANPLTAQGLATPYQLTATNPADGPCNEANPNQTAFVQAAVIDPATGQISVYNPLVIDQGTAPAAAPAVPALPAGGVAGIWFGFNGNTLSLVGADQVAATGGTATPSAGTTTPAATMTPAAPATATPAPVPTSPAPAPATSPAAAPATSPAAVPATSPAAAPATSPAAGVPAAVAATPMPTAAAATSPAATAPAPAAAAGGAMQTSGPPAIVNPSPSPAASATASAPAAATVTMPAVTGTAPPAATDTPAGSGTPDAILQGADCVAGENVAGQGFSPFTQVAACNAAAFFAAANTAIGNGLLTVPSPGTAADGQACLTTRNFGVVDQDMSDNVTTKYLAVNGQIAQDTAGNTAQLAGATVLVNGSDNALIDNFVDPALHCTPWMVNDLANPGTMTTALPLDELQSAAFDTGGNGGPAALVPLNDPMTLDNNGNMSANKTNAYRAIVDQPVLPAGETPAQFCGDLESIQGVRLQQDVNLLVGGTSPAPAAASNLFTFLAMRLQQSFTNLNCQNFGLQNMVSTTADGNGVVVAACFSQQVNAVTPGAGNPTAGMTTCPATTTTGTPTPGATATPAATASATPVATPTPTWRRHRHHHHHFR